jgi:hypothetical protein
MRNAPHDAIACPDCAHAHLFDRPGVWCATCRDTGTICALCGKPWCDCPPEHEATLEPESELTVPRR